MKNEIQTTEKQSFGGVDIDKLSELLKTHTQAIFERAWEQLHDFEPNPDLTGFEDVIQIIDSEEQNGEV